MNQQTEVFPAPDITEFLAPRGQWEKNRDYFCEHLLELLRDYRGKFVAIHHDEIVAVGDSFIETAKAAYSACGYGPIYIDEVMESPRPPGRISSPRRDRT